METLSKDYKDVLWWLINFNYTLDSYNGEYYFYQPTQGYVNPIKRHAANRTTLIRMQNVGLLDSNYRPTLEAKKRLYAEL
jgi:hypothetical protein